MTGEPSDWAAKIARRPQDAYVDAHRPEPAMPPSVGVTLSGVLGNSDREGHRRLYLTHRLDRHVDFANSDVVDVVDIPPEAAPFVGRAGTAVTLRPGAPVHFTSSHVADDVDIVFGLPFPDELGCPVTFTDASSTCYSRHTMCK